MLLSKKELKNIKNDFDIMYDDRSFPTFDEDKYLNLYREYPFFLNASNTIYDEYVDISSIYGDNWSFESKDDRGRYPSVNKLKAIVDYYGGILHHYNKELPPVPLYKIGDVYYLEEGNHRLYVLKYLESKGYIKNPKIYATVCEYDYKTFLNESTIIEYNDGKYIKYDGCYIERITDEECDKINYLKELYYIK